eukprot:8839314-Pyramimonas_sp.AAC.1
MLSSALGLHWREFFSFTGCAIACATGATHRQGPCTRAVIPMSCSGCATGCTHNYSPSHQTGTRGCHRWAN